MALAAGLRFPAGFQRQSHHQNLLATSAAPNAVPTVAEKTAISDFFIGSLLGEGAYARVHVCKLKSSGEYFALKVMEKRFILKEQARRPSHPLVEIAKASVSHINFCDVFLHRKQTL